MRRAVRLALIAVSFALGFVVFSLQGWGQQDVFVRGKGEAGYPVVPCDHSTEKVPSFPPVG